MELGDIGFDRGAHLLVKRALTSHARVRVHGSHPELKPHLRAWARAQGHGCEGDVVSRGSADRWTGASRAGTAAPDGVVAHPEASWGLAARGALVEAGESLFEGLIGVEDVAEAFDLIMHQGKVGNIYNIGSRDCLSVHDLADKICAATGQPGNIAHVPDRLYNDCR